MLEAFAEQLVYCCEKRRKGFAEPVGAAMSVWRLSRIAVQPRACAEVGLPSVSENH
jgi:hypothetical protein